MSALAFVALNIADAYLTKIGTAAGAIEVNPLMASIGSCMITKGLIAAALVGALYFSGKEKFLWFLNLGLFGIVLWNSATCLIVNLWPLHSFISTHASF